MKKQYDEMFKKQCLELVVKEGRTISGIQREFDLGNGMKVYFCAALDIGTRRVLGYSLDTHQDA